jgi:uncharacterized membrane protein
VISGIIFLIPVFVIIVILQKLFTTMKGLGQQLANLLGIKTVAGFGGATIGTTILLLATFYACGLLVRFTMFTAMRSWLENKLLMHIPGYLGYKVKMEEKLLPKTEKRVAALVTTADITRPGFLVARENGRCTVFIPNTPDTDTGQVWIVNEGQVKELGIAEKSFIDGIRHSGKGLVLG